MKTSAFIHEHGACSDGAKWALSVSTDMADVWDALIEQGKYGWLLWTATQPGVFPIDTLRKLACRFARETPLADGRTVWDLLADERSRHAVETAEAYADGKATGEELNSARSAAYNAYCAAGAARAAADAVEAAHDVYVSNTADAADYAAAKAAAYEAANAAANAAAYAAAADDNAAYAARSAQAKMIAELGNPFKKGASK